MIVAGGDGTLMEVSYTVTMISDTTPCTTLLGSQWTVEKRRCGELKLHGSLLISISPDALYVQAPTHLIRKLPYSILEYSCRCYPSRQGEPLLLVTLLFTSLLHPSKVSDTVVAINTTTDDNYNLATHRSRN